MPPGEKQCERAIVVRQNAHAAREWATQSRQPLLLPLKRLEEESFEGGGYEFRSAEGAHLLCPDVPETSQNCSAA